MDKKRLNIMKITNEELIKRIEPFDGELKVISCNIFFEDDETTEENALVMVNTPKDFEAEKYYRDNEIMYYCHDIEDFKHLMQPNNGEGFVICLPFNVN